MNICGFKISDQPHAAKRKSKKKRGSHQLVIANLKKWAANYYPATAKPQGNIISIICMKCAIQQFSQYIKLLQTVKCKNWFIS